MIVRKHATPTSRNDPLRKQNLPCVVAGQVQKRHFLIIAILCSPILAIADNEDPRFHVYIWPVGPADLLLSHRCNAANRNNLPTMALEILNEFAELIFSWTSVSLFRLSDKTQMLHCKVR